ncbi:4-hydroxy-tetrahydrodipicolinate reductase [Aquimarina sp. ERC-38]|uniref:4-hydroxy-tetrahydrodipicolinate reductase n=1 Tax=Aquimarina sp. ERC-38 TaxID=2949996 RepID=UPI002247BBE1|nr:4-hydroxy-tetrahydrodipicolinate reductase [Aquimarina sp. ERC-38]UZO79453.1 4-hydroxy-tetrahydrodipicolinate reductase [Aquimarina sp. ERC-38]
MKIALLGYGKMGKTIEKIAIERGHQVVLKADEHTDLSTLKEAEVAIDFSVPTAAVGNITSCFNAGVPVVSGTTGWLSEYDQVIQQCKTLNGSFIYASNFSLGVNLFFELNKKLARMMSPVEGYDITMEEIHHTQKLDAPSGTAITLAEGIIEEHKEKTQWSLEERGKDSITIDAKRIDQVPGTHTVTYTSQVDDLMIRHTAHNRQGFALGAVVAAEWLHNKKGVFTMKDVLGLS